MTLRELSKRTGYSVSVLSRALNPRPDSSCNISASTRSKIRKLVRDIGFRPNRLASCMRRGKVPSIGVFLPTYSGSLISDAIFGISRAAAERKLPLNFYFGETNDFCFFLERMIEEGCTGIIAGSNVIQRSGTASVSLVNRYIGEGGKLVFFNEHPSPLPETAGNLQSYSILSYDDHAGGMLAAKHLQFLKCRLLLFIEIGASSCYEVRRAGFEQHCQENELRYQIMNCSDANSYGRKFTAEFFSPLLQFLQKQKEKPIGLFVPSDYKLLDLMVHLSSSDLKIAQHVHLVGYNYNDFTACISGWPFATLQQDFVKEGHLAITMLEELMDGKNGKVLLLQPQLKLCNLQVQAEQQSHS